MKRTLKIRYSERLILPQIENAGNLCSNYPVISVFGGVTDRFMENSSDFSGNHNFNPLSSLFDRQRIQELSTFILFLINHTFWNLSFSSLFDYPRNLQVRLVSFLLDRSLSFIGSSALTQYRQFSGVGPSTFTNLD